MKLVKNKIGRTQTLLTLLVWVIIFAMPLMFSETKEGRNWPHILKVWKEYGMVFILFLINRFFLLPKLFFNQKRWAYFLSLSGFIVLFSLFVFYTDKGNVPLGNQNGPRPPRAEMHDDFKGGHPPRPKMRNDREPPPFEDREAMPPPGRRAMDMVPAFANLFIMSILILGFDSGLVFSIKWMQSEQNKLKIEKESIKNKMAFLQNQISPHFFMNTLNNIHALVDIDSEEAKEAIIRLSKMMDYMLYESQSSIISVKQEMEFVKSYVELMKLRITDDVELIMDIPSILPSVKIPPLLTISYIENAFKYGISYESPSYVHIKFYISENNFFFKIENRIHQEIKRNKNHGIGLENSKNRLDLLFGSNYALNINNEDDKFEVNLNFPI